MFVVGNKNPVRINICPTFPFVLYDKVWGDEVEFLSFSVEVNDAVGLPMYDYYKCSIAIHAITLLLLELKYIEASNMSYFSMLLKVRFYTLYLDTPYIASLYCAIATMSPHGFKLSQLFFFFHLFSLSFKISDPSNTLTLFIYLLIDLSFALLDHVSRAHEIEISPSPVRPSLCNYL